MCVLTEMQPQRRCMGDVQLKRFSASCLPPPYIEDGLCTQTTRKGGQRPPLLRLLGGSCTETLLLSC